MRNKEAKDTVHTQRRERIKHLQYKGKEKRSRGWWGLLWYVARDGTKQFSRKFRNIGFSRDKKLCYVWETQNICFELISRNYLNKQFRSTSNPPPPLLCGEVYECVCVYIFQSEYLNRICIYFRPSSGKA